MADIDVEEQVSIIQQAKTLKILLIGEVETDKLTILFKYAHKIMSDEEFKDVFQVFEFQIPYESESLSELGTKVKINTIFNIQLTFIPHSNEYERLRNIIYAGHDAIIFVFSLLYKQTLDMLIEKWFAEIHEVLPQAPIFVIGNHRESFNSDTAIKLDIVTGEYVDLLVQNIEPRVLVYCDSDSGLLIEESFNEIFYYLQLPEETETQIETKALYCKIFGYRRDQNMELTRVDVDNDNNQPWLNFQLK